MSLGHSASVVQTWFLFAENLLTHRVSSSCTWELVVFLLFSVRTSDFLASEMRQSIFPWEECILLLKSYNGKWKVGAKIARPRPGGRNLRQVF